MLKKLQNRLNESKGFTLVELIVVIAIMVILIALLVPNVVGYISSSQTTANLSAAKSVYNAANTAVVNGKASSGAFPNAAQLCNLLNGNSIDSSTDSAGEVLVIVPEGTSATIVYDTTKGNVVAVAAVTGATAPTSAAPTSTANIAIYNPAVSGNYAENSGASSIFTASAGVQLLKCNNGGDWTA